MRSVVPRVYYTCHTGGIVTGLHATHREKGMGGGVIVAEKMAEKQPCIRLCSRFSPWNYKGKYIWYAEVDFRCVYDVLLGADHADKSFFPAWPVENGTAHRLLLTAEKRKGLATCQPIFVKRIPLMPALRRADTLQTNSLEYRSRRAPP